MCHLKASDATTKMVSSVISISPNSRIECLRSIERQIVRSWNLNEKTIRFAFDTDCESRGSVKLPRSQFEKVEGETPSDVDRIEWAFSLV